MFRYGNETIRFTLSKCDGIKTETISKRVFLLAVLFIIRSLFRSQSIELKGATIWFVFLKITLEKRI